MTDARREPSTAVADGDTLLVYDAGNRLLWRRQFDGPLPFNGDDSLSGPGRRVWVKDVNGDGAREVLVFAPTDGTRWPVTLYCFGADGTELWTRSPKSSVRFGKNDYSPPWSGHWMFITGPAHSPALWVTWVHVKSGFFPTLLEQVSGKDGQPQSEYRSAGYVEFVMWAIVQGRPSILVGAANNDHVGASLSVFDADKVTGSAAAESPDKVCGNCPPGGPRAFLVFPQLEMSRLCGGVPAVIDARVADDGELGVWVRQTCPEGAGAASYQLDRELRPVSAEIGAEYRASHKMLESRLKHPFGERDQRELWPVLVYDGARFVKVTGRTTGQTTGQTTR
jgi:hypothetical protein